MLTVPIKAAKGASQYDAVGIWQICRDEMATPGSSGALCPSADRIGFFGSLGLAVSLGIGFKNGIINKAMSPSEANVCRGMAKNLGDRLKAGVMVDFDMANPSTPYEVTHMRNLAIAVNSGNKAGPYDFDLFGVDAVRNDDSREETYVEYEDLREVEDYQNLREIGILEKVIMKGGNYSDALDNTGGQYSDRIRAGLSKIVGEIRAFEISLFKIEFKPEEFFPLIYRLNLLLPGISNALGENEFIRYPTENNRNILRKLQGIISESGVNLIATLEVLNRVFIGQRIGFKSYISQPGVLQKYVNAILGCGGLKKSRIIDALKILAKKADSEEVNIDAEIASILRAVELDTPDRFDYGSTEAIPFKSVIIAFLGAASTIKKIVPDRIELLKNAVAEPTKSKAEQIGTRPMAEHFEQVVNRERKKLLIALRGAEIRRDMIMNMFENYVATYFNAFFASFEGFDQINQYLQSMDFVTLSARDDSKFISPYDLGGDEYGLVNVINKAQFGFINKARRLHDCVKLIANGPDLRVEFSSLDMAAFLTGKQVFAGNKPKEPNAAKLARYSSLLASPLVIAPIAMPEVEEFVEFSYENAARILLEKSAEYQEQERQRKERDRLEAIERAEKERLARIRQAEWEAAEKIRKAEEARIQEEERRRTELLKEEAWGETNLVLAAADERIELIKETIRTTGKTVTGYGPYEIIMDYGSELLGAPISRELRTKMFDVLKKQYNLLGIEFEDIRSLPLDFTRAYQYKTELNEWVRRREAADSELIIRGINYCIEIAQQVGGETNKGLLNSLLLIKNLDIKFGRIVGLVENVAMILFENLTQIEAHYNRCGTGARGRDFNAQYSILKFLRDNREIIVQLQRTPIGAK